MNVSAYAKLTAMARTPEALDKTAEYLAGKFQQFLKKQDRLFICYPDGGPGSLGHILGQGVCRMGGIPVFWEDDFRWKTLLRQVFASRAAAIAGPPYVLLGLAKLARATNTPLFLRDVVLTGCAAASWMEEGLRRWLDCHLWNCYTAGPSGLIAGFACGKSSGLQLWSDRYCVKLLDEMGREVPQGERGEVVLSAKADPGISYPTGEYARLRADSPCGDNSPQLYDLDRGKTVDNQQCTLDEALLSWFSVLDYHAMRTPLGLDLEVVTFPGEQLPRHPSCAKLHIRPWNPEIEIPFSVRYWGETAD